MKKMIFSIIACAALVLAALVVWSLSPSWAMSLGVNHVWFDMLACVIFITALIPSCLFAQAHDEFKAINE